jgi:hypothetical protein
MRATRTLTTVLLLAAAVAATVPSGAVATADAAARWAPAATAKIGPGVMMYTKGAQCTGNFVFTDRRGRVYVGYAAHCAGRGTATDTNGCKTASWPLGTPVRFSPDGNLAGGGTTVGRGRLVYSSWRTMRRLHVRSANACAYNDFALVRVDRRFVREVNPSVPFWGGPVGLNRKGTAAGDQVYSYGNSSLRAGLSPLSPKTGVSLGDEAGGWSRTVYTAGPGIPGDSGSGFLDAQGRALGVLSTVAIAPLAGSNGVGDLPHELRFAQRHSGIRGLRLVPGTVPFNPGP